MLERKYIIPLRKQFSKVQKYKRGYKAIKSVREFLMQHMKVDDVRIGKELNQEILKHGHENPPSKVEVRAIKIEEKDNKPYVKVNLINVKIEVEVEKKKKGIAEKLKEKVTAKTDEPSDYEKEKHEILDHAKLEHPRQETPEKFTKKKSSPKAEMIIGETGKK